MKTQSTRLLIPVVVVADHMVAPEDRVLMEMTGERASYPLRPAVSWNDSNGTLPQNMDLGSISPGANSASSIDIASPGAFLIRQLWPPKSRHGKQHETASGQIATGNSRPKTPEPSSRGFTRKYNEAKDWRIYVPFTESCTRLEPQQMVIGRTALQRGSLSASSLGKVCHA